jgi:N-dimethylarginine dimethylaminohydrolase
MKATPSGLTEHGRLGRVILKHPRDAFSSAAQIDRQWQALGFTAAPDLARAVEEYEVFLEHLRRVTSDLQFLDADPAAGLDSVYTRDAAILCDRGVIRCAMGKAARTAEPVLLGDALRNLDVPVAGAIEPPGRLEGGDLVWLDPRTVVVGRGYRTNDEGIRQLRALLDDSIDELVTVPLVHWRGPGDVFHLMSFLSPIDADLAVVYSPLMPVPFREWLIGRGVQLVEVPDEEFDSMGANVLALAPRRCLALDGNPVTRRRLEAAGADVIVYSGREISLKGGGGPTCLARPLWRHAAARSHSGG